MEILYLQTSGWEDSTEYDDAEHRPQSHHFFTPNPGWIIPASRRTGEFGSLGVVEANICLEKSLDPPRKLKSNESEMSSP